MFEWPAHLHPMVVHFPIALFIMALVFEVLSFVGKSDGLHKAAFYMYVAAALTTPFVAATGMVEAKRLGLHHPVLEQHEHFGLALAGAALLSLPVLWFVYKKSEKYFRVVFIIFLILSAGLVSLTGDKGGDMVYEYGVGVEK